MKNCIFCELIKGTKHSRIIAQNGHCVAIYDKYPVSEGHTLIIPKQHIVSFFELTEDQLLAIYALMKEMKERLFNEFGAEDFNIGINEGRAAGRTIDHLHIHIIPRYPGDVELPAGGVRHILDKNREFYREMLEKKL